MRNGTQARQARWQSIAAIRTRCIGNQASRRNDSIGNATFAPMICAAPRRQSCRNEESSNVYLSNGYLFAVPLVEPSAIQSVAWRLSLLEVTYAICPDGAIQHDHESQILHG